MVAALKTIGCRGIDRHAARPCFLIRLQARMDLQGFETVSVFFIHRVLYKGKNPAFESRIVFIAAHEKLPPAGSVTHAHPTNRHAMRLRSVAIPGNSCVVRHHNRKILRANIAIFSNSYRCVYKMPSTVSFDFGSTFAEEGII